MDPTVFLGKSSNLYIYVGNDPININDPAGLKKCAGKSWVECYSNCVDKLVSPALGAGVVSSIISSLPYEFAAAAPGEGMIYLHALSNLSPSIYRSLLFVSRSVFAPIAAVGYGFAAGASYGCMLSCLENTGKY